MNRIKKSYPLHLSYQYFLRVMNFLEVDSFIVYDINNIPIASSINYKINDDVYQVIYWGNKPGTDSLKPMNFLAFKMFEYYKNKGIKFLDIGPSTDKGEPNFGLCDFKQSIGCQTSLKFTFNYDFL